MKAYYNIVRSSGDQEKLCVVLIFDVNEVLEYCHVEPDIGLEVRWGNHVLAEELSARDHCRDQGHTERSGHIFRRTLFGTAYDNKMLDRFFTLAIKTGLLSVFAVSKKRVRIEKRPACLVIKRNGEDPEDVLIKPKKIEIPTIECPEDWQKVKKIEEEIRFQCQHRSLYDTMIRCVKNTYSRYVVEVLQKCVKFVYSSFIKKPLTSAFTTAGLGLMLNALINCDRIVAVLQRMWRWIF